MTATNIAPVAISDRSAASILRRQRLAQPPDQPLEGALELRHRRDVVVERHLPRLGDHLSLLADWKISGLHYQRTAELWLQNMDAHRDEILPLFTDTYGPNQAKKWWSYWRIFYMSCAELWGYRGGAEWLVSHYLFRKP